MADLIFIAGAPGVGKSSIAHLLHAETKGPLFEFGWIPEFRIKGNAEIPYEEEEALSFENLVLVLKNYLKHGFKNIVVTDLEDRRILELDKIFVGKLYKIITLTIGDDEALKTRVTSTSRENDYRDFEKAIAINRAILARSFLQNEVRVDTTNRSIEEIFNEVKTLLQGTD